MVSQENKRGFCSGVLKEPYARTEPTDVIKICFIENNRPHHYFLLTPAEALTLGSCLAWAYVEWLEQEKYDVEK